MVSILDQIKQNGLDIGIENIKITTFTAEAQALHVSWLSWMHHVNSSCSGTTSKKKACEDTKNNHYRPKANEALAAENIAWGKVNEAKARIVILTAEKTTNEGAKKSEDQAIIELGKKGLTSEAVQTAATADAEVTILQGTKEADQKANRNRLFLIFGIFLLLVVVFIVVKKLRKPKTAKS
jgi:DNA segregation ATPase FtsK/SpoIIIE-like protein